MKGPKMKCTVDKESQAMLIRIMSSKIVIRFQVIAAVLRICLPRSVLFDPY